ncbi:MAG: hypothetical protein CMF57_11460 [Leifsonia sp.]|nr:hypothetical protein [Leifsonia sp.]
MSAMPRRPLALVAPLLVLALVGCTPTTVIPPAGPPSEEAPLFASDEEALAAATEAYEEFLAALDAKLQNPPSPEVVLNGFAESQALDEAVQSVEQFEAEGLRITAPREVTSVQLQMVVRVDGATEVVFYACEDVAGVDLLNAEGESLVTSDRPDLSAWESSAVFRPGGALVNSRTLWTGGGVC